jgi:triosephosphate isomerase
MHTTLPEAVALARTLGERLAIYETVDRLVCPPFISLAAVAEVLRGRSIAVGAQNMYYEDQGAFTGEIAPTMLVGIASHVIIGHSERRQHFGETDQDVNRKLQAALRHGLVPIVCVGERLEQRDRGETETVITTQVRAALAGIADLGPTVIAYEPVWAIGTGRAATGPLANETIGLIRRTVAAMAGEPVAAAMRILYGGSVTPANIAEFMAQPEIDGGLVGGASLKADDFTAIVQQAAEQAART